MENICYSDMAWIICHEQGADGVWFRGVRLLPFLASLEESVDEGGSNFFAFFYFPFDPYSVKSLQYY